MCGRRPATVEVVADAVSRSADGFLSSLDRRVRLLAAPLDLALRERGCTAYVKTIYVGYEIDGGMAAALYAHADRVELALALPQDADHPLLIDAAHLTWRTMPVAAVIRGSTDVRAAVALVAEACERVRTGRHDVQLDDQVFASARRNSGRKGIASQPRRSRPWERGFNAPQ